MTNAAPLDTAVLEVMRAHAALAPLIAELAAAQRHGNLDRIGNAAYDAQGQGDILTQALSAAFAMAADLTAAAYDARQTPSPTLLLASA